MKTSALALVATLTLCALGTLGVTACGPQKEVAPLEAARTSGRTYTTRGQVTQLPDPANPGSGLYLSHEAIDNFVDRDGKTVGMDPMNMPFPVAEGVSLAGIAPADLVEFDLYVDWQADTPVAITRIRKLPPDTKLVFNAARPDKAEATPK
jgi:hypothetical protein